MSACTADAESGMGQSDAEREGLGERATRLLRDSLELSGLVSMAMTSGEGRAGRGACAVTSDLISVCSQGLTADLEPVRPARLRLMFLKTL